MKLIFKINSNFIRIIFLLSAISKLIYKETFMSWFLSFIKFLQLEYEITFYISNTDITQIFLYLIIIFEIFIAFYLEILGIYILSLIFMILSFFISFYAHILNISPDCGCFGEIFVFTNSIDKLAFTFVILLFLIIHGVATYNKRFTQPKKIN